MSASEPPARRGQKIRRVLNTQDRDAPLARLQAAQKQQNPSSVLAAGGGVARIRLLADLNEKMESGVGITEAEQGQLWADWLWVSSPDGSLLDACGGMNDMHLRGVLLARSMGMGWVRAQQGAHDNDSASVPDLLPECDDVHVHETPVCTMTVRELRDSLEACQLNMRRLLDVEGAQHCRLALFRFFIRFGVLASGAFEDTVMDDPSNITAIPTETAGRVLFILTCKALRTFVNVFLALFRVVDIAARHTPIDVCAEPGVAEGVCAVPGKYVDMVKAMIKTFHVEASLDAFNVLQQLYFLAPGQRLVYRHNFAGMFNDISQVTYFHYPRYVRSPQISVDMMGEHAMHSLPCLGSIIPQVSVVYDDDPTTPFGGGNASAWVWVVSCQRVYLWDGSRGRLLSSRGPGVLDLAAYYLLCNHGLDFFREGGGASEDAGNVGDTHTRMTDFSHARLLKRKDPS